MQFLQVYWRGLYFWFRCYRRSNYVCIRPIAGRRSHRRTGEFRDGERGHLYTNAAGSVTGATIDIIEWDTSTDTATIRLIDGTTVGATCMRGEASGASFGIHTIGLTQEYFAKDGLEDNTEIDFEAASFL